MFSTFDHILRKSSIFKMTLVIIRCVCTGTLYDVPFTYIWFDIVHWWWVSCCHIVISLDRTLYYLKNFGLSIEDGVNLLS